MLIPDKINNLKFLRYLVIIVFAVSMNLILGRISDIDENKTKQIEILSVQNKIYKKLSHPQYLKTNEISEYNKILDITQDQYDEIKVDKINENMYWCILAITIFSIWKLNGLLITKIDNQN